MARDFDLEDFVGERVGVDLGVGEEGDEAFLEGAETAFDFAFGLRGWGDEMSDAEGAQGALELATGVEVVVGGAGAEEAECVGVDGLGDAVALEGFAEVLEVGPSGVAGDEAAGDVEAGVVVDGQEEGLFFGAGPPLVDGAVVLEEFAETGAAEAAVGARFFPDRRDEVGQVGFDVGFDAGSGAFEAVEAQEFVGDELEVAWGLERDEFAQEGDGGLGPGGALVAAAGVEMECLTVLEPAGSKLVEAGFADMEELAGLCRVDVADIEGVEGLLDEVKGMAVEELALFISAIHSICGRRGTPIFARFLAGSLPRPALRSGLLRDPAKKRVKCDFHAKCTFPLLFRLSSLLNRRGHFSLIRLPVLLPFPP